MVENRCTSTIPCTSSSSSVRSMTEPLGRAAGTAALDGVDPAAWLSEKKTGKNVDINVEITSRKEKKTQQQITIPRGETETMNQATQVVCCVTCEMTHRWHRKAAQTYETLVSYV